MLSLMMMNDEVRNLLGESSFKIILADRSQLKRIDLLKDVMLKNSFELLLSAIRTTAMLSAQRLSTGLISKK